MAADACCRRTHARETAPRQNLWSMLQDRLACSSSRAAISRRSAACNVVPASRAVCNPHRAWRARSDVSKIVAAFFAT